MLLMHAGGLGLMKINFRGFLFYASQQSGIAASRMRQKTSSAMSIIQLAGQSWPGLTPEKLKKITELNFAFCWGLTTVPAPGQLPASRA